LPQLVNVVRGEMSLVGPRPERPEFVRVLAANIPFYLDRLQIMPGITGLAQLNLPPDTDLTSVRRKLVLDQEYVDTASVTLDLRILLATALRVVGLRGYRAVQWMGLERSVVLEDEEAPSDEQRIMDANEVEYCPGTA
jgi:lipopolysaccharide/colanic/teichoic acid biosynthesis glycosyltransferase